MEYRKVIYITKGEEKFCNKYLTVEPKSEEDCLPDGCQMVSTAEFDNGYEMEWNVYWYILTSVCNITQGMYVSAEYFTIYLKL